MREAPEDEAGRTLAREEGHPPPRLIHDLEEEGAITIECRAQAVRQIDAWLLSNGFETLKRINRIPRFNRLGWLWTPRGEFTRSIPIIV